MALAARDRRDKLVTQAAIHNLPRGRLPNHTVRVRRQVLDIRKATSAGTCAAPSKQFTCSRHGRAVEGAARHEAHLLSVQTARGYSARHWLIRMVLVVHGQTGCVPEAAATQMETAPRQKFALLRGDQAVVLSARNSNHSSSVQNPTSHELRHWLERPIVLVAWHLRGLCEAATPAIRSAPREELPAVADSQIVPPTTCHCNHLALCEAATHHMPRDRLVRHIVVRGHARDIRDATPASIGLSPSIKLTARCDGQAV
mmetsp:Transcript_83043/g.216380  ORF Transcript_83043/g.216380 Transcript_83043/m.216380 type:complete len:257 (+) Transcript_83043:311-1081(+)